MEKGVNAENGRKIPGNTQQIMENYENAGKSSKIQQQTEKSQNNPDIINKIIGNF